MTFDLHRLLVALRPRPRHRALNSLPNAALKDLGIDRSEIASCAKADRTRRRSAPPNS